MQPTLSSSKEIQGFGDILGIGYLLDLCISSFSDIPNLSLITYLMSLLFDVGETFMIYDVGARQLKKTYNEIMQRLLSLQQ